MPCGSNKPKQPTPKAKLQWVCGVTTVAIPDRRETLLPRTLASLDAAGFPRPWLFIDGENNCDWWDRHYPDHGKTLRYPTIRTHGNWVLSMYELYIRNPTAERYAMFQDDMVACANLRAYLDDSPYPPEGYLNLYTIPRNETVFPNIGQTGRRRWGWFQSGQNGWGAVALVFSRDAVLALLSARHLVTRPMDPHRGWKAVDGGIVDSMRKAGFKEYVHNPSLVQHTGEQSSMRKSGKNWYARSDCFLGENFDALEILKSPNYLDK